jgi:hypothetical protein
MVAIQTEYIIELIKFKFTQSVSLEGAKKVSIPVKNKTKV